MNKEIIKEILEDLNTIGFKNNIAIKYSLNNSEVDRYLENLLNLNLIKTRYSLSKTIGNNHKPIITGYLLTFEGQNWLDNN